MNLFSFIKSRVAIADVIGEYVSLKPAGLYLKGSCPFHAEKTASFTVSAHREIFYCFGCHASGDVIGFIAKVENCSQLEAAQHLAERYAIELPTGASSPEAKEQLSALGQQKKQYYALCQEVTSWSKQMLTTHDHARNYLMSRGFCNATLSLFQVGYFPGGNKGVSALREFMTKKDFLVADLIAAHILAQGKQTLYSPFEERLIFPIKDHLGRHCGFGARIFNATDERAKYYNSRENQFFNKSTLLFGLDLARKSMQEEGIAFLVEGYTDCMAMVQHGYTNTCATLGTACTVEHLTMLARYVHTVYVLYDGDQAGRKAMLRMAELCFHVNLELRVITLPAQEDPASFLLAGGNLAPLISNAQDIFRFYVDALGPSFAALPLAHKLQTINKLLDLLKTIDSPVKRDLLLQQGSQALSVPFESLKRELDRKKTPFLSTTPDTPTQNSRPVSFLATVSPLEKQLFSVILFDHRALEKVEQHSMTKYFTDPLALILGKLCRHNKDGQGDFPSFFDSLPASEQQMVTQIIMEYGQEDKDGGEQLFMQFQKKHWKSIAHDIKMQISKAEQEDDKERVKDLLMQFQTFKEKLLAKESA